eukprot:NODE_297_length_10490_cov_1.102974.p7 type:complete len:138 gc:universal NODE_297_length_10490_cov_1.102974:2929-3342(+)
MLITFDGNKSDKVQIHGSFNDWKAIDMYYNEKIEKFEAYIPITETIIFKFTKNGDWMLGDYEIVKDDNGNENHQIIFKNVKEILLPLTNSQSAAITKKEETISTQNVKVDEKMETKVAPKKISLLTRVKTKLKKLTR